MTKVVLSFFTTKYSTVVHKIKQLTALQIRSMRRRRRVLLKDAGRAKPVPVDIPYTRISGTQHAPRRKEERRISVNEQEERRVPHILHSL